MGAWGGLCSFDWTRYEHEVIPAFRADEADPRVQHTIQLMQLRPLSQHDTRAFCGLANLAPFFDPLLTTCALGQSFVVCDGVILAHHDPDGPCTDYWTCEDAAVLFEWLLTRYTITHYTIVGLIYNSVERLFPAELDLDDLTQTLVYQLNTRCRYWATGGGFGEGLHGWLDPDETELLALGLAEFAPTQTPASARSEVHPQLWTYCCENSSAPMDTYVEHMGRILQFIRLLEHAVSYRRGVVWGRDLRLFYEPASLFAADERIPEKVA